MRVVVTKAMDDRGRHAVPLLYTTVEVPPSMFIDVPVM